MGCFHLLTIVNNVAMIVVVQIPVQIPAFTSFGYTLRSGVAGLHRHSVFSIFRDCHTIVHSDCPILHAHQQSASYFLADIIPTMPYSQQYKTSIHLILFFNLTLNF